MVLACNVPLPIPTLYPPWSPVPPIVKLPEPEPMNKLLSNTLAGEKAWKYLTAFIFICPTMLVVVGRLSPPEDRVPVVVRAPEPKLRESFAT